MFARGSAYLLALLLSAFSRSSGLTLPCSVHGFSTSGHGFVALLADQPRDRYVPLVVAEDSERVSSPQALTLLQLLQGIDLGGVTFPPEQLQALAGVNDATLQRVLVKDAESFELCIDVIGEERLVSCPSGFEAVALAMRYRLPLSVDAAFIDTVSMDQAECAARFPHSYSAADATEQSSEISRRMAGLPPRESTEPKATRSALDLQAFDVASLRRAVDECAPTPPPVEEGLNANGAPPKMLERVLALARKKGDLEAVAKIEKQIKVEQLKRDIAERDRKQSGS